MKKWILTFILATMFIPGEITVLVNYFSLIQVDLIDTYWALILPFSASGLGVFLFYQFFQSIPKELEEAAWIDGCSRLRFLSRILVPVAWPAVVAFSLYAFISTWNQYLWPLIATRTTEMQTVQIGLTMFRAQNESMSWGVVMAGTALLIAPIVLLFIATQNHFVRGMTMTGLK